MGSLLRVKISEPPSGSDHLTQSAVVERIWRMKSIAQAIIWALVGISFIGAPSRAQTTDLMLVDSLQQESGPLSPASAIRRASLLLGATVNEGSAIDSPNVTIEVTDSRGFGGPDPDGRPNLGRTYHVRMLGLAMHMRGKTVSRDVEIFIDSISGLLLKIVTTGPNYVDKVAAGKIRVGSSSGAPAEQFPLASWEYDGPPKQHPNVSFVEALKATPSNPLLADCIIARFVQLKHVSFGSQSVWVVETWGGWSSVGSTPPGYQEHKQKKAPAAKAEREHLRTIVDQDGKLLVAEG